MVRPAKTVSTTGIPTSGTNSKSLVLTTSAFTSSGGMVLPSCSPTGALYLFAHLPRGLILRTSPVRRSRTLARIHREFIAFCQRGGVGHGGGVISPAPYRKG